MRPGPGSDAPIRLLIADRDPLLRHAMEGALINCLGVHPETVGCGSPQDVAAALRVAPFQIVLADSGCLDGATDQAVSRIARLAPDALLVLFVSESSVSASWGLMRAGAHDVIAKPIDMSSLSQRISGLARLHGRSGLVAPRSQEDRAEPQTQSLARKQPPVLPLWQQEQQIIEDAIARYAGNIALAAAALEISPSTIYRKRQSWGEAATKGA